MLMDNNRKKVWSKCYKGYEWEASISNRNRDRKCLFVDMKNWNEQTQYEICFFSDIIFSETNSNKAKKW